MSDVTSTYDQKWTHSIGDIAASKLTIAGSSGSKYMEVTIESTDAEGYGAQRIALSHDQWNELARRVQVSRLLGEPAAALTFKEPLE